MASLSDVKISLEESYYNFSNIVQDFFLERNKKDIDINFLLDEISKEIIQYKENKKIPTSREYTALVNILCGLAEFVALESLAKKFNLDKECFLANAEFANELNIIDFTSEGDYGPLHISFSLKSKYKENNPDLSQEISDLKNIIFYIPRHFVIDLYKKFDITVGRLSFACEQALE